MDVMCGMYPRHHVLHTHTYALHTLPQWRRRGGRRVQLRDPRDPMYSLDPPLRDQASQGWSHLLASQLHWGHLLSPWAHLLGPTSLRPLGPSLRPLGPSLRPLWAHLLGQMRSKWSVLQYVIWAGSYVRPRRRAVSNSQVSIRFQKVKLEHSLL